MARPAVRVSSTVTVRAVGGPMFPDGSIARTSMVWAPSEANVRSPRSEQLVNDTSASNRHWVVLPDPLEKKV